MNLGMCINGRIFTDTMILDLNMFPDLTWEDEPIEVELVIKHKQ